MTARTHEILGFPRQNAGRREIQVMKAVVLIVDDDPGIVELRAQLFW